MKDFLLIYRNEFSPVPTTSPEEMQAMTKKWMDWIGSIAAQNKLTERGNRLNTDARVLRSSELVTDGPYMEIKEAISGYSIVKTENIEEAVEIAKGCPIFLVGGSVEVREVGVIAMPS